MVPFYSIESWLFQNTEEVNTTCQREHNGNTTKCGNLPTDRSELDEILMIKDECCLKSRFNSELASNNFPTKEAYNVGKSFKAFVDSLRIVVTYIDQEYVTSKQEEIAFYWQEKGFTPENLPQVSTRKESELLLSLLDGERTEEETLQQFNQNSEG